RDAAVRDEDRDVAAAERGGVAGRGAREDIQRVLQLQDVDHFWRGRGLRRHRRGACRQQETQYDASFHLSSSSKRRLYPEPASVWDNTALETLILADNGLAELPEGIGALTKLRTLDLGHNVLEDLPESLGQLADLADYLYLHDNRLTALRESLFTRLIRLRYLNVSDNRLAALPASIGNLSSLEELRADGNQLTSLPASFSRL